MSTRYVCDWCGDEFEDRAQVASVDVTIDAINEKLHMCAECAPSHLRQHYPDERKKVADGGRGPMARAAELRKRADRLEVQAAAADPDVRTDGGTELPEGAVDHSFDEAERSTREVLQEGVADVRTAPLPGSVALDLVTRQLLLVRRESYPDLAAHYEAEDYSLLEYGVHPYLPVSVDDAVYECVYLSDVTAESLANFGDAKTYSFPAGRLAHVPTEEAGDGE